MTTGSAEHDSDDGQQAVTILKKITALADAAEPDALAIAHRLSTAEELVDDEAVLAYVDGARAFEVDEPAFRTAIERAIDEFSEDDGDGEDPTARVRACAACGDDATTRVGDGVYSCDEHADLADGCVSGGDLRAR